jgi:hypothetical protein
MLRQSCMGWVVCSDEVWGGLRQNDEFSEVWGGLSVDRVLLSVKYEVSEGGVMLLTG